MLRRQKDALSKSMTPFACTLVCFFRRILGHSKGLLQAPGTVPLQNLKVTSHERRRKLFTYQGAAKGVHQKEFDHFFRFRDSFGHFLVTFSDASVTFFAFAIFVPNSFCRTPFVAG